MSKYGFNAHVTSHVANAPQRAAHSHNSHATGTPWRGLKRHSVGSVDSHCAAAVKTRALK